MLWEINVNKSKLLSSSCLRASGEVTTDAQFVLEGQAVLRAGRALEGGAEAPLGRCGLKALSILQAAGCVHAGKVPDSLACSGEMRGQTCKVAKRRKKRNRNRKKKRRRRLAGLSTSSTLPVRCPPLATRAECHFSSPSL